MKYIKVTHIESGNEEFFPINKVNTHYINGNYIEHFETKK